MKGAVIQIDATPFRLWYQQHYGVEVGLKKGMTTHKKEGDAAPATQSTHVKRKLSERIKASGGAGHGAGGAVRHRCALDAQGRLLAHVSRRLRCHTAHALRACSAAQHASRELFRTPVRCVRCAHSLFAQAVCTRRSPRAPASAAAAMGTYWKAKH